MVSYERAWVLGDVHWGIYASRYKSWMEMMDEFFTELFIPFLEENVKPGDVLIQLGDWFDNQSSINIRVGNLAMDRLIDMSNILPVHILVGNHDIWGKAPVTQYNSMRAYKYFPNVTLHDTPEIIQIANKRCLMMPWYHDKEEEQKCLKDHVSDADIVFCHSDLVGSRTTLRKDFDTRKQEIIASLSTGHSALDLTDFDGYESVYSGHIHIRHKQGKFQFCGTPYELNTNDMDNDKGWWLIDPDKDKVDFYHNQFSPRFRHIRIDDENDMKTIDPELVKKDMCYLFINSEILTNPKLRKRLNEIMRLPWKDRVFYKDEHAISEQVASSRAVKDISKPVVLDRKTTYEITHNSIDELDLDDLKKQDMKQELDRAFGILDSM